MGPDAVKQDNFATVATVTSIVGGNVAIVKTLVEKTELDVDQQGKTGKSLLLWACYFGKSDVVKYLLDTGADYSITDNSGDSALQIALKRGFRDIATMLRNYGATS